MRSIEEIDESLAGRFGEKSGTALIEGGDMSLRLWALAGEIFTLEVQADFVARQSFPQTATGEYLDKHAEVRALSRAGAERSFGTLRFYLDQERDVDIDVPEGVVCMNAAEAQFVTTHSGTIAAGTTWCDVRAEASEAGSGGNVPAGSVRYCALTPAGVAGVTNLAAFTGGRDPESDDSLRQRVLSSYQSLPNGANRAYYESKVLENSAAVAVAVLPKERGTGTVDVYFATGTGVPDEEEIAKVQQLLDSEREICVNIEVKAPETVDVSVAARLTVSQGYTFAGVKERAEKALAECFGGTMRGRNVYRARLAAALMAVDGVENCTLVSPEEDVTVTAAQLPVLVSLRVEEAV